jgi:hypothetical protein
MVSHGEVGFDIGFVHIFSNCAAESHLIEKKKKK